MEDSPVKKATAELQTISSLIDSQSKVIAEIKDIISYTENKVADQSTPYSNKLDMISNRLMENNKELRRIREILQAI